MSDINAPKLQYSTVSNPLSVAPMMDRTDRHFRYFLRLISRETLLYTEMVTTQAILHGDLDRLLGFSPEEKPLVLQLGGDNPQDLARCAKIAEDFGYDEVNLNVGCPSDRVQSGSFGACLMLRPEQVAECVSAMRAATHLPITVKHRIGVDDHDSYDEMLNFVKIVASAGCQRFSVHARKAWLKGLSPKENRDIPPLRYEDVYRLKQELTLAETQKHLQKVDAVMIGRAAYDNPYLFAEADRLIFQSNDRPLTRHEVVEAMLPYIDYWTVQKQRKLHGLIRHMLQLFAGQPGSRVWKRILTEKASQPGASSEVVCEALAQVPSSSSFVETDHLP
jgi:tRNA-dihydrouridine synthase A